MTRLFLLLALALPAQAQAPTSAVIQCGSLQGAGVVMLTVADTTYVVRVMCGTQI